MKVQTLDNRTDMIKFISNLNYGQNYIYKPKDFLFEDIQERVFIINKSLNSDSLRFEKVEDKILLEFNGYLLEHNIWSVISCIENKLIPVLSEDSYCIKKFAQKAFNDKEVIFFDLDKSLYSYARKLNFNNKVNFAILNGKACFNGLEKQLSVFKRIEHAYYSGEDTIDFDTKTTSISTVRCYASTLSNLSGKKIKCSSRDGLITVFFKEEDRHSQLKRKLGYLLNEFEEDADAIDFLLMMVAEIKEKNKPDNHSDTGFEEYDDSEF